MPHPNAFANTHRFYGLFGWFHAVWTATELNIDWAIGKLKRIPPGQTHPLVAKLKFSNKVAMLRSLLRDSDYKNRAELEEFLSRIEKDALRNAFAHSFLASDAETVAFIHRRQGQYRADSYRFTADKFEAHVRGFVQLAADFRQALGVSDAEIGNFAAEAVTEEKHG
jgi:hypothetical protein